MCTVSAAQCYGRKVCLWHCLRLASNPNMIQIMEIRSLAVLQKLSKLKWEDWGTLSELKAVPNIKVWCLHCRNPSSKAVQVNLDSQTTEILKSSDMTWGWHCLVSLLPSMYTARFSPALGQWWLSLLLIAMDAFSIQQHLGKEHKQ